MKLKIIFLSSFLLTACLGFKPFQPAPDEYKSWIKSGVTNKQVKEALLQCGYPSIYGFNKKSYIPNEVALAEKCMFNKGFNYSSGYKGMCSIGNRKNLPACQQERACSNREEPGCAPINSLYTQYTKEGATESDVKAAMLRCGYPNVFDTNDKYPDSEIANGEKCMYQHGFDYRSGYGYKRLCAKPVQKSSLPYCQGDESTQKTINSQYEGK